MLQPGRYRYLVPPRDFIGMIWPVGYSVASEDGRWVMRDATGADVAGIGEPMGYGAKWSPNAPSTGANIPARCGGAAWYNKVINVDPQRYIASYYRPQNIVHDLYRYVHQGDCRIVMQLLAPTPQTSALGHRPAFCRMVASGHPGFPPHIRIRSTRYRNEKSLALVTISEEGHRPQNREDLTWVLMNADGDWGVLASARSLAPLPPPPSQD